MRNGSRHLSQSSAGGTASDHRPPGLAVPPPIPWSRVRELSKHDELSFEAHSVNHLAVSCLREQDLITELESSRSRIEEWTGRKVNHFCYPYGSPREVGQTAPNVVRNRFDSATTTSRGRCSSSADLALLPRVPLDGADLEEVAALKVGTAR